MSDKFRPPPDVVGVELFETVDITHETCGLCGRMFGEHGRVQQDGKTFASCPPVSLFTIELSVRFLPERPIEISGRQGLLYVAEITRCPAGGIDRDGLTRILIGQRVIGRGWIRAVESHCVMSLGEGAKIGLLIEGP